ncbi:MAG: hypothetical protein PWQ97_852, partial [Tepidanaerobacteraceae bacterium]|nr:hypothetical protein [Tepidanaerobacteraceae bacterium]
RQPGCHSESYLTLDPVALRPYLSISLPLSLVFCLQEVFFSTSGISGSYSIHMLAGLAGLEQLAPFPVQLAVFWV